MLICMYDEKPVAQVSESGNHSAAFDFTASDYNDRMKKCDQDSHKWIADMRRQLVVSERECQNVCINI